MSSGTSTLVRLVLIAAASSPLQAQTVREKVAVDVITVRLTARDAAGRHVEDLAVKDLSLTVDGRSVAIETLSGPEGRLTAARGPEAGDGAAAAAGRVETGRSLRTLIFIDEGATHPFDLKDVREELARYIEASGARRELFLVARFDGHLKIESPWSDDRRATVAAVRRVSGALNRVSSPAQGEGFGPNDGLFIQQYREDFQAALLEALAAFPDESAERRLVVVSGGMDLMRPADLAAVLGCQLTPNERTRLTAGGNRDVAATHARDIQRATFALWSRSVNPAGDVLSTSDVVGKAIERDVAIVPVRAEAMDRGDFDLSGRGGASPGGSSAQLWSGQAMTEIAESTGAEPVLVPKKAADRLQELTGRAAYTLTFRDPLGDHRYHQVAVACRRPGVKIEYRRGYRIPVEDERTLDMVVAGFLQPRKAADPMEATISQSLDSSEKRTSSRLDILYSPPLETGALAERPIEVIAVGEDPAGNRTEPIEWKGTAYSREGTKDFEAAMLLGVPPTYSWSVAVRDEPTGLTSFVFLPAPARH